MESKNIYQRINAVMKEVQYVQKDAAITGGGQNYRAVTHDQVVSVARAALVEHGIMTYPEQTSGEFLIKRDLSATPPVKMGLYSGSYIIHFVNIDNGEDRVSVAVEAHANDNGDKAPGKALTYATKAAMLKVLNLETGENEESRAENLERQNVIDQFQCQQLYPYLTEQDEGGNTVWNKTAQRLLTAYKIQSIEQLPATKFDEVVKKLGGSK